MSKRGVFSGHPPLPVSKHFGKLNNVGKVLAQEEEPSTSSLEDTRAFFAADGKTLDLFQGVGLIFSSKNQYAFRPG